MSGTSIGNATSLAAASLQATDVIPVERPGVTTPYKAKVSSLSKAIAGMINVQDYGAVGDGVTDDTAAIQTAATAAAGGKLWIPRTSSFYNITEVVMVASNTIIDSDGAHIKNTGSSAPSGWAGDTGFWDNVFSVGNYGGETSDTRGPLWALTYYGIAAASKGDRLVTLDTAAEDSNFTAGDVVFIKAGTNFTTQISGKDIPKYVMVNIVDSVASGVINLVYPLNHNFDAAASIATDAETFTGLDGETSYVARNVQIRNLILETTHADNWSGIHISAVESVFENLEIIVPTRSGIGANPNAFNKYKNITIKGMSDEALAAFEMAHLSNNVEVDGLTITVGQLNCSECGSYIEVKNFWIGDGYISTSRKHNVTLRDGTVARTSSITANFGCIILATQTEGNSVDNVKVLSPGASTYGVLIVNDSIGATVRNSLICGGPTTGYAAVHVQGTAMDYHIEGNTIGISGSRTEQDFINAVDEGANGTIKNNSSKLSRKEVFDTFYTTSRETAETVRKTYAVPAGTLRLRNAIRITAFGNVTGTNGQKDIRIRIGAVTGNPAMLTITYTAGQTGYFRIEAILGCGGYAAAGTIHGSYVYWGAGTTLTGQAEYVASTTADLTADFDITLTHELASGSDEVAIRGWYVEQLNDQWIHI